METGKKCGKMYKRGFIIVMAFVLIGVMMSMLISFTNPIWLTSSISLARPNAVIRRDLLRVTPIGTSMEDVVNTFDDNGWHYVRRIRGNFMEGNRMVNSFTDEAVEIGTQSILVFFGHVLLAVNNGASYAFDEESKLIDIVIWRELDVP